MPGTAGPRHGLVWGYAPGEAGWGVAGFNPNFAKLDALVHLTVITITATPPATPANGDCYIVGDSPTGAWVGHADDVAVYYTSGGWMFIDPAVGVRAFDRSADMYVRFDGVDWIDEIVPAADVAGPASAADAHIAVYNGTTGKIIKDGGQGLPAGFIVGTTDTQILTHKVIDGNDNSLVVHLNTDVTGNLAVSHLGGGVGASNTTVWHGDGTWRVPAGGGGGGGATITVSDTPPASPAAGQMWFDSTTACLFIWYEDSTSGQWCIAVNVGSSGGGGGALGAAPIDSPVLTGDPRSVTPATSDNDTSIATTAFVKAQGYVTGGPYLPLAGGTLTGALTAPDVNITAPGYTSLDISGDSGSTMLSLGHGAGNSYIAASGVSNLNFQTNGANRLSIDGSGNAVVAGNLTVTGNNAVGLRMVNTTDNTRYGMYVDFTSLRLAPVDAAGVPGALHVHIAAATGNATFYGTTFNTAGSWSVISDRELKQDIETYDRGLEALLQLTPCYFRYRAGTPFATEDDASTIRIGLMADEVSPVIPEIVGRTTVEVNAAPREVDYITPGDLVYVLLNAVKELSARVEELEARPPNPPEMQPA